MLAFYLAMCETPEQEDVFTAMYYENRKTMLVKAESILQSNGWAEDAVHDAFIRIADNIETFLPLACNERRYLCVSIVKNVALNMLRDSHQSSMDPFEDEFIPSENTDLTDDMIKVERLAELKQHIDELPFSLCEVIRYRLVIGLSTAQTASILQISDEAVRVRLHRGRKLLIAKLAKVGIING